jgi:hypothetical protein
VRARSGELVTTNEPTIIAKPLPDAIVMEDGQRDGCFTDPSGTDESDGLQVFSETEDLLNQLITSKTSPRWWGRRFSVCARCKDQIPNLLVV